MEKVLSTLEFNSGKVVAETLLRELVNRNLTISVAEGCSGGSILDSLTIPGATKSFHVGGVFYSRRSKINLGVPEEIIDCYGEYSMETALHMAQAVQKINNDSFGIATVGNIEPTNDLNPRQIYLGFSSYDSKQWGEIVTLPSLTPRLLAKKQITYLSLENVLFYLFGKDNVNISGHTLNAAMVTSSSAEEKQLSKISQTLVNKLRGYNLKISTMESCTGGAIANAITDISGASNVYDSGWVAYDENIKAQLGVPLLTMSHGVYTEKVSLEMARAILNKTDSDIAIATTGTMDTMDTRPFHNDTSPGTVFITVFYRNRKPLVCKLNLRVKSREQMKIEIASLALELVIQMIEKSEMKLLVPRQWDNNFIVVSRG